MSAKVVQFKYIGTVTFNRNRRSKNIKISVKPDKSVLVSFPFFVREAEAADFVLKNEGWIVQQQQKQNARRIGFYEGQVIKTKYYELHLQAGEKYFASINKEKANVFLIEFESERAISFVEKVITEIYRREAKRILPKRLKHLADAFGFTFNKVTIRNNKRNWGSCSSKNNISLNLQMMKMPDHLIDYILLHELVHTKIKNHGEKFWELLNQITNGKAKPLAREVKKFSTYTL